MSSKTRKKDDSNNPDLSLPGIGNYVFQKTVGEGNFAKVKLATHKLTNAEVAIKIIDKTQLDEKKLGKLYREVRIMKMLHHPNIVKLYEVIETKSTVFLVMEYVSGGELYDYLVVHGKMKEKDARQKFRQILSAVNYCHKKRVIHRDLKAENLLLDANLNIKIADFGFSNYFDPDGKLDTFCGSPPYAAPELFQGRRYTGPEVDVWSLGVILYVLTTGCLPFDGKNLQEMRESVCRGKYRIPFYLSDTCEKLLRKFLVRDPTKRGSLDMLIDDPWINESYTDSPITIDESQTIEEDENIIKLIEVKFKLDKDIILQSIRDNVYNDISALYYVLYHEQGTRDKIASQVSIPEITTINNPKSPVKQPNMTPIDEDGVLQEPLKKPSTTTTAATSRRRRATTVTGTDTEKESPKDLEPLKPIVAPHSSQPKSATESAPPSTSDAPIRKRNNTIVGIFRNKTAQPEVVIPEATSKELHDAEPSEPNKPRSLRFTFNSTSTSSKAPDEIIQEVIKAITKASISYRLLSRYLIECTVPLEKEPLKFEVEVCKLPRLNNLHGLRFKRLGGPSSEYKETCEKILKTVSL